ncbi:MBOAT family O-acyltransferase [Pontibacter sp. G13]|uniref:MBOAT family O-acyltransferase n=1 Tax=Pontibacter sp. G13 TaxID=3074898 RepID=UPI00288953BE|nr:MBOAT family O-acyltransferase [Pontibacter sp. G13]WNJ20303.1 MBOAT family O-acyltransferase [Pontibacter sp. G13]
MVFSSSLFLLYVLPAFLLVYALTPRQGKNLVILLFSILFYSWGAPKFVFVILGSTMLDFYLVQTMHRSTQDRTRKLLLGTSLAMNVGLLLYFKYANFFVDNVHAMMAAVGMEPFAWTKVLLPIGISFYTFQTLTYAIDVYRKVHDPLDKLTDYLLYIMSFPQMIAGPIVRFNTIADQILYRESKVENFLIGCYRFCIGLGKKVLIANVMGEQADLIMNGDLTQLDAGMAWLGILAYTFQIYFDFSGYSDMAIGLGRMMGFTFPENFHFPYISRNISEFWRRWHITLGDFMRDYLYIPLGGNRSKTTVRRYANLWIVFLISGLWHGSSWNFVLWGAFHGCFLILDRLFLVKLLDRFGHIPSVLFTFLVTMIGWVIFRLESLSEIGLYLGSLADISSFQMPNVLPGFYPILAVAALFSFLPLSRLGENWANIAFFRDRYRPISHLGWTLISLCLLVLSIAYIASSDFNPFIYFRF